MILIFAFAATKVYEIFCLVFRFFCLLYLLIVLLFIVFIVALLLCSRPIVFLYFIDWCFFMFRFVCVCVSACLLYVSPCREGPFLDVQRNLLVTFNILMFLLRALWILHVLIHFYGVVVVMGRSILLCFFFIWRTLVRLRML